MLRFRSLLMLAALLALAAGAGAQAKKTTKAPQAKKTSRAATTTAAAADDPSQAQIAGWLTEKPVAFGRPIADRAAWQALAATPAGQEVLRAAERLLTTPMPPKPDSLFLEYTTKGIRENCDSRDRLRRARVRTLTEAECMENKGRFLPELEKDIRELATEKTWVSPAHDGKLNNFNKTLVDIELFGSELAWNLATADYLLGDKLSPGVRQLIRTELQWRIFDPFHKMEAGTQPRYWLNVTNNWNSVCLAQVTGAALALIDSREERAFYVAAALKYSRNFLKGFTPDGYCGEGIGYWSYGFGHYILLSEIIRLATDHHIDLLARKSAVAPAAFPARTEITAGVYPAFADVAPGTKPALYLVDFVNKRFGMGLNLAPPAPWKYNGGRLFEDMMYLFPVPADRNASIPGESVRTGPRTWFDSAKVLICRPGPGASARLAVAINGSDNGVSHNHNDVGTFILLAGGQSVIDDVGGEVYTARTFGPKRYDSNVLNSFGHCCPVVAGKLQDTGAQAQAVTLATDFTPARDTIKFDIKSAYASVKELKSLTRQYVYSRQGAGSLTVTDTVAFDSPQTFEEALITLGTWKQTGPATLQISEGGQTVEVQFESGGKALEIKAVAINERIHASGLPTRVGISFKESVTQATFTMKITPVGGK